MGEELSLGTGRMVVAGGAVAVVGAAELRRSLPVAFDAQSVHRVHVADRETGTARIFRSHPRALTMKCELMAMAALDGAVRGSRARPRLIASGMTGGACIPSAEPLEIADVVVVIENVGGRPHVAMTAPARCVLVHWIGHVVALIA